MNTISQHRARTAMSSSSSRGRSLPTAFTKETIQRLSTPKQKDKRWIPDRPSVYWLDYIIDPTPHSIKDPEDLAGYYGNFDSRFQRTRLLSAPRKYYGMQFREDDDGYRRSDTSGIPLSALTYTATDRIRELAKPKTAGRAETSFDEEDKESRMRPVTSRRSLSNTRSRSPQEKGRYFDPRVDYARGDFPSRFKHDIEATKAKQRSISAGNNAKSRSLTTRSNPAIPEGRGDETRRPMRRNPYSLKR